MSENFLPVMALVPTLTANRCSAVRPRGGPPEDGPSIAVTVMFAVPTKPVEAVMTS